jgi:Ni,Fe-hydrogenase III large subunit/NADH:ubiquinone oxidoreductase subunit C
MKGIICIEIEGNPGNISLKDIPVLDYKDFCNQTISLLKKEVYHCLDYFVYNNSGFLDFYILIANDDSHKILIFSHRQKSDIKELESITKSCSQLHVFEREIAETTGILFVGHPWLKPVRYPHNKADQGTAIKDYPFYRIDSEETHEVGVGPIHAGIIEPGHFRFMCYGEKVLHLEIQLGYQHRGAEDLFLKKKGLLQRSLIAENISGDTTIGHSIAFSQLSESLSGKEVSKNLQSERIIALEMERMAVHIGDMAALCGDVAYQIGQVSCEALRTLVINAMQDWCGNRFGKGLVRPGGTNFPLDPGLAGRICDRLDEVHKRFHEVAELVFRNSEVVTRFENTGHVSSRQAALAGAVGMAARTSGIDRDIRKSHPFMAFREMDYKPALLEGGDVLARAMLRNMEFELSYGIVKELISEIKKQSARSAERPVYNLDFKPGMLAVGLTEGWRGEICHSALTDNNGDIILYSVKDPSLHNWMVLALAVRDQEISDFPVCNKSFNLSYCGNDL